MAELPPKVGSRVEAKFMSMSVELYRAWSAEPAKWRSHAGDMLVSSMTDDHVRRVREQIRERADTFASLYVWGLIYLAGEEAATDLCVLYHANPLDVLAITPVYQALEARSEV